MLVHTDKLLCICKLNPGQIHGKLIGGPYCGAWSGLCLFTQNFPPSHHGSCSNFILCPTLILLSASLPSLLNQCQACVSALVNECTHNLLLLSSTDVSNNMAFVDVMHHSCGLCHHSEVYPILFYLYIAIEERIITLKYHCLKIKDVDIVYFAMTCLETSKKYSSVVINGCEGESTTWRGFFSSCGRR